MSLSSLRFLHAAGIFLGRPIHRDGISSAAVDPDTLELIDNATLVTFDRVIDDAIEREVDFLLLAGNSFVDAEQSLSARLDLLNGLDRLAEREIRVFVCPGECDSPEAWRAIPDLPDNVTIFYDRENEPVAVLRDGKVIATVACSATLPAPRPKEQRPETTLRSDAIRRTPYSVLFLTDCSETSAVQSRGTADTESGDSTASLVDAPADYVALCEGASRRTVALKMGLAHHPGPAQSLTCRHTGPAGCTLVEVDTDGTTQCSFLPTAAVIWEPQELNLTSATTEADLTEQLQTATERFSALPHETVRVVRWAVRGEGPVWEMLADDERQRRFLERLAERTSTESAERVLHQFRLLVDAETARALAGEDTLARDFLDVVEKDARLPHDALGRCLDEAALADDEWSRKLRMLVPYLDHERIFSHARRLGTSWFGSAKGGSRTV